MSTTFEIIVHSLRLEAEDVLGIELRPQEGRFLPKFDAGAHIDLHLPNGLLRSYSLINAPGETHRYVIAVLRDKASRGGSVFIHEQLRVGTTLTVSAPRNNFRLNENATHTVLVAGGIGVTPLLCMARRLRQLGKSLELLYFSRARKSAAFFNELQALGVPVHWHFDDEIGGPPDLTSLLTSRLSPAGTHLYACGPTAMLDNVVAVCERLGHTEVHLERFGGISRTCSGFVSKSYTVELKRSGREIEVTSEKSLLQTLLEAGIDIDYSCQEGICGACETTVLSGEPDHRDNVLSARDKAANRVMMVCVSGCRSERLTLDL